MTRALLESLPHLRERLAEAPAVIWIISLEGALLIELGGELRPDPRLTSFVAEIADYPKNHVAIIGDQALAAIERMVPDRRFILVGANGLEVRGMGRQDSLFDLGGLRPGLLEILRFWQREARPIEGARIEDHGGMLVLHHPPDRGRCRETLMRIAMETVSRLGEGSGLEFVARGRGFIVRPRGLSRGMAVNRIVRHFAEPGTLTILLGTRADDEETFAALVGLSAIGIALDGPCDLTGATHHMRPGQSMIEALGPLSAP